MISHGKIEAMRKFWENNYSLISNELNFYEFLPTSGTHLDFGCGIGFFTFKLASERPNLMVEGLDINNDEINASKSLFNLKNLNFFVGGILNKKYDSITLIYTIHEIEQDLNNFLKNLHKHLNEEGKLMIYDFRRTNRKKFMKNYKNNPDPSKKSFEEEYTEHNKWSVKEFKIILEKARFKTILIKKSGDYCLSYVGLKGGTSK